MSEAPISFCVRFWPVFAALSSMAIPHPRRHAFGLVLAVIGFILAIVGALTVLPIPSGTNLLFCFSAGLPLLSMLHRPTATQIAPIFLVTYLIEWLCLTSDLPLIASGCTVLLTVRLILALATESRIRPTYNWGRLALTACTLTLSGAVLLSDRVSLAPSDWMPGSILVIAGFAVTLSILDEARRVGSHDCMTALLQAGIILGAVAGLTRLHPSAGLGHAAIIITSAVAAMVIFRNGSNIALSCCFAVMASVLPGMQWVAGTLAVTACLGAYAEPDPSAENWLISFLPPSPLLPATLVLFWTLTTQSVPMACAFLTIVLGQVFLTSTRFPDGRAWRTTPVLWLLLALGVSSPFFLTGFPVVKGDLP